MNNYNKHLNRFRDNENGGVMQRMRNQLPPIDPKTGALIKEDLRAKTQRIAIEVGTIRLQREQLQLQGGKLSHPPTGRHNTPRPALTTIDNRRVDYDDD